MKPDVSTEIVAVPSSCASMHESHYWPTSDAIDGCSNPTYNCLQYELNDGTYVVASADVCGIYGNGSTAENAVEDFCTAIKTRMADKLGGIYSGTSDFEFQEREFSGLERDWNEDGVHVHQRHRVSISVVDGTLKSV